MGFTREEQELEIRVTGTQDVHALTAALNAEAAARKDAEAEALRELESIDRANAARNTGVASVIALANALRQEADARKLAETEAIRELETLEKMPAVLAAQARAAQHAAAETRALSAGTAQLIVSMGQTAGEAYHLADSYELVERAETRVTAAAGAMGAAVEASGAKASGGMAASARSAFLYQQRITALGYALNDFFSVQGSLTNRLNAIANNMPMLLAGFGHWGLALSAIMPIVGALLPMLDQLAKALGFADAPKYAIDAITLIQARIKELEKNPAKLSMDLDSLRQAQEQLDKLKKDLAAFRSLEEQRTSAQQRSAAAVANVLQESTRPDLTPEQVDARAREEARRDPNVKRFERDAEEARARGDAEAEARAEENKRRQTEALRAAVPAKSSASLMKTQAAVEITASDPTVIDLKGKIDALWKKVETARQERRAAEVDDEIMRGNLPISARLPRAPRAPGAPVVTAEALKAQEDEARAQARALENDLRNRVRGIVNVDAPARVGGELEQAKQGNVRPLAERLKKVGRVDVAEDVEAASPEAMKAQQKARETVGGFLDTNLVKPATARKGEIEQAQAEQERERARIADVQAGRDRLTADQREAFERGKGLVRKDRADVAEQTATEAIAKFGPNDPRVLQATQAAATHPDVRPDVAADVAYAVAKEIIEGVRKELAGAPLPVRFAEPPAPVKLPSGRTAPAPGQMGEGYAPTRPTATPTSPQQPTPTAAAIPDVPAQAPAPVVNVAPAPAPVVNVAAAPVPAQVHGPAPVVNPVVNVAAPAAPAPVVVPAPAVNVAPPVVNVPPFIPQPPPAAPTGVLGALAVGLAGEVPDEAPNPTTTTTRRERREAETREAIHGQREREAERDPVRATETRGRIADEAADETDRKARGSEAVARAVAEQDGKTATRQARVKEVMDRGEAVAVAPVPGPPVQAPDEPPAAPKGLKLRKAQFEARKAQQASQAKPKLVGLKLRKAERDARIREQKARRQRNAPAPPVDPVQRAAQAKVIEQEQQREQAPQQAAAAVGAQQARQGAQQALGVVPQVAQAQAAYMAQIQAQNQAYQAELQRLYQLFAAGAQQQQQQARQHRMQGQRQVQDFYSSIGGGTY